MLHTFICDPCGLGIQDTNTKKIHKCPECGGDMRWDLRGNVSGKSDYRHVSDSLAFHPDDIPEHRRKFPGVDVTPEGQPVFTSAKQQERYAEKCGFYKKEQKRKRRGVRIA